MVRVGDRDKDRVKLGFGRRMHRSETSLDVSVWIGAGLHVECCRVRARARVRAGPVLII